MYSLTRKRRARSRRCKSLGHKDLRQFFEKSHAIKTDWLGDLTCHKQISKKTQILILGGHMVNVKRLPQQAFDTVKTEVKKTFP